jgi:mono/diheme cytochrome c family protein
VLVATGVYTSLLHVPSWVALQDTSYGAALSGKLIAFAVLLGLGAINLLVMGPRLRRAWARPPRKDDGSGTRQTFRWIVLGEVVLGAAVLAVTGVLTGLPPAGSLQLEARPYNDTQRSANATITLGVRPNQAGENRIEISLADDRGAPLADVERVRLTLTMLDMEMGPREVRAQPVEPGRFEVVGNQLSMSDHWRAEVAAQRPGGEERATYSFVVGQAPGANRPTLSPARIVANALNAGSFLTIVALAGGALILARRMNLRRRDRRWATVAAAALFVIGFGVGGATVADAYRRRLPNPVPADAASLARGQEIYQESCASCHGISGRGDGPAGVMLRPRPADFRVHMAAGHTDQELFEWVTNGVQGAAMPPFKDGLTEEGRWHVINYIRTFAER